MSLKRLVRPHPMTLPSQKQIVDEEQQKEGDAYEHPPHPPVVRPIAELFCASPTERNGSFCMTSSTGLVALLPRDSCYRLGQWAPFGLSACRLPFARPSALPQPRRQSPSSVPLLSLRSTAQALHARSLAASDLRGTRHFALGRRGGGEEIARGSLLPST